MTGTLYCGPFFSAIHPNHLTEFESFVQQGKFQTGCQPQDPVKAKHNLDYRAARHNFPLLTSSSLTKIGIIYIYSTSAGGKDLSYDAQIRVIGAMEAMEPELCTKVLRNWSEKRIVAKFLATTRGYSMEKIARLDDAFSDVFER